MMDHFINLSAGVSDIPAKVFKTLIPLIASFLVDLFNDFLKQFIFPVEFKLAIVTQHFT